jgi:hypothetical protein
LVTNTSETQAVVYTHKIGSYSIKEKILPTVLKTNKFSQIGEGNDQRGQKGFVHVNV